MNTNSVTKFTTSLLNSIFGIVLFIVSCVTFFLPYEIRIVPEIAALLPKVQMVCAGLLIICFLLLYASQVRVFRDNWLLLASTVFIAILIYATYINYADMDSALSDKGLLALANLLMFAVFFKVNPKKYLLIFYFIYLIFMAANNYSVFATWGTGMWNEWQTYLDDTYSLVGNYNLGIMYAMPVLITGSVWASKYGRWLEIINYLACFSCIWMAFKCNSLAQILAYVLAVVIFVLNDIMHAAPGFYKFLRIFNSAVLMAAVTALFLIVVVFEKLDWLNKLGVDADFHGRRAIWHNSMALISQSPVFGNGVETIGTTASKFGETQAAHSHCFFLEVPYLTGAVGTVVFIVMLILCIAAVFRAKNIHTKWLLSTFMGTTFLAAVVESYPTVFMIIVLGLVYYIAKKDREEELEKDAIFEAADNAAAMRQPYAAHSGAISLNELRNNNRNNDQNRYQDSAQKTDYNKPYNGVANSNQNTQQNVSRNAYQGKTQDSSRRDNNSHNAGLNLNQRREQNSNRGSNQNSGNNSNRNSNQNMQQNANRNAYQNSGQNAYQNRQQNVGQNQYQNTYGNMNSNAYQNAPQNVNQGYYQQGTQNSYGYAGQNQYQQGTYNNGQNGYGYAGQNQYQQGSYNNGQNGYGNINQNPYQTTSKNVQQNQYGSRVQNMNGAVNQNAKRSGSTSSADRHLAARANVKKTLEEDVFNIDDILDEQADYIADNIKNNRKM